ncbi:MAG TPA: hypothetical protein VKD72_02035 [Gemmataceae bacterium]|nr:hypothetical protein [Gemmataceae bacterium]
MSARWFQPGLHNDLRGDKGLPGLSPLAHLIPGEEHFALLAVPARSNPLRRKDDLLDDGVAAVFGLAGGEAGLVGLCFDAGRFTPGQAARWLAGRGFAPLLLVPNAGGCHG